MNYFYITIFTSKKVKDILNRTIPATNTPTAAILLLQFLQAEMIFTSRKAKSWLLRDNLLIYHPLFMVYLSLQTKCYFHIKIFINKKVKTAKEVLNTNNSSTTGTFIAAFFTL